MLAVICDGHKRGRLVCGEQGLLQKLLSLLSSMVRAQPALTLPSHAVSADTLLVFAAAYWYCKTQA